MKKGFMKSMNGVVVAVGVLVSVNQAQADVRFEFDGEVADMKPLQLANARVQNAEQGWNQLGYLENRYKERMPLPKSLEGKNNKAQKVVKKIRSQVKKVRQ